jgi:Glyoxalase-like domain
VESSVTVVPMPSVIKTVTFDAADELALARFWAAVFGSDVDGESTAGRAYLEAAGWGGPNIWFARVPEGKTAKNRVHFDLRAPGRVNDEVARLEQLGARVLERHQHHVVMQDPEGNEFCVEPGPADAPV